MRCFAKDLHRNHFNGHFGGAFLWRAAFNSLRGRIVTIKAAFLQQCFAHHIPTWEVMMLETAFFYRLDPIQLLEMDQLYKDALREELDRLDQEAAWAPPAWVGGFGHQSSNSSTAATQGDSDYHEDSDYLPSSPLGPPPVPLQRQNAVCSRQLLNPDDGLN